MSYRLVEFAKQIGSSRITNLHISEKISNLHETEIFRRALLKRELRSSQDVPPPPPSISGLPDRITRVYLGEELAILDPGVSFLWKLEASNQKTLGIENSQ